ncbi:MAG: hypothetical protein ACKN9E_13210 [Microcystaceae cyanobacterium]
MLQTLKFIDLSSPDLTKNDKIFIILSALNQDMANTIKDCESISTKVLMEYQAQIINALQLID